MEQENKSIIYIYDDYGVNDTCSDDTEEWLNEHINSINNGDGEKIVEIKRITAEQIRNDALENTQVDGLFFPGGNTIDCIVGLEGLDQFKAPTNATKQKRTELKIKALNHIKELEKSETENADSPVQTQIKKFVENGGIVTGTCAGAYYLSEVMKYEFEKIGGNIDITAKSNVTLHSIEALAHGEPHNYLDVKEHKHYYSNAVVNYTNEQGEIKQAQMPCNKGPYFRQLDEKVFALASYGSRKDQLTKEELNGNKTGLYPDRPCLIKSNYGKGRIIAMGVHPEFSQDTIKNRFIKAVGKTLFKKKKDKENTTDDFSRSVVLDDLMGVIKHKLEFGKRPERLKKLSDNDFANKMAKKGTPVKISRKSDKNKVKDCCDALEPMIDADPHLSVQKKSQSSEIKPKEEVKVKPLQGPKPPNQ